MEVASEPNGQGTEAADSSDSMESLQGDRDDRRSQSSENRSSGLERESEVIEDRWMMPVVRTIREQRVRSRERQKEAASALDHRETEARTPDVIGYM